MHVIKFQLFIQKGIGYTQLQIRGSRILIIVFGKTISGIKPSKLQIKGK